jgi:hypothetical protein
MPRYFATRCCTALVSAMLVAAANLAAAAAIDDVKIDAGQDLCESSGINSQNHVVYATNLNSNQAIDARFKYDTVPAQQHFILFDAGLNPITDRFPKFHTRRLAPGETAAVGCTLTYRASPQPPGPMTVPITIAKQSAAYVNLNAAEGDPDEARSFAAFYLQGGINECGSGAKPPGLLYLVNLHPYARLSASIDLLDERGNRVGARATDLSPLSATRVACSNGLSRPGPITSSSLDVLGGAAAPVTAVPLAETKPPSPEAGATQTLASLSLDLVFRAQHVCAGSVPAGWIKIDDTWNPTVCGNPATLTYNVWTIQQLSDQPVGTVIYACSATVPTRWAIVGTVWNPTLCGHPAANQANVMAIKRMN